MTVPAFLGLLASSQQFGWLVTDALEFMDVSFPRELGTYRERDVMFTEQLELVLMYTKMPELKCRFITGVLPVMYGNLFKYCGADAGNYLKEIESPNFYDNLYGAQVA